MKTADPRAPVTTRYQDRQTYIDRVAEAVRELAADRLLLPEDVAAYVDTAQRLAWPPSPIDGAPYWRLEPEVRRPR